MKKHLINFLLLLSCTFSVYCQTDTTGYIEEDPFASPFSSTEEVLKGLEWNGYFQTDNRLNLFNGNDRFTREEYRLSLMPVVKSKNVTFRSELWVRTLKYPSAKSYTALSDKNAIQPVDLDLREAYIEIYSFLTPNLDVKVGKQRIAWGTADKLNPTDNLNPYDLEDLWDFGRHLSSNAIKLSYYLNDFTFTGVFISGFTPSLAPDSQFVKAFTPDLNFPGSFNNNGSIINLVYNNITDSLVLPDRGINNAIYGFKVEKPFGSYNTSLSYVYGRDILPAPYKTVITPVAIAGSSMTIDLKSYIRYPRMHIIGGDFAGSLFNIGVWGEAAVFLPEKTTNNTTISLNGLTLLEMDSVTVDDKPYFKVAAGFDYTFRNSWYLNIQYLHGFIHEKGNALTDYYVVNLNIPTFNDKLTLSPLNTCIQTDGYTDFKNNAAIVFMPEFSYSGIQNVNIAVGFRMIEGSDKTAFGKLKTNDELFLRLKYSF